MSTILFTILGLYILEHLILFFGILRNAGSSIKSLKNENELPSVSVVVAARNEENNITACIESLLKLDYPKDKLEVVLVNDNSTDKTGEIMQSYLNSNPHLKYILTGEVESKLKGKTRALANALKQTKSEIIFTTDADIEVQPSWVRELVNYYDDKTAVVSSFTNIKPIGLNSGVQSLDWLYLLCIACGSDGVNFPISCVGNNMSYRRTAYDKVGGYENVKFSVTEDFMLLHTIGRKTKMNTKFPVTNSAVNYTLPCATFIELYRQKKRWATGGLGLITVGYIVGGINFLTAAAMLLGWLFMGIETYLFFVGVKSIVDFIFIFPAVKVFKLWKVFLYLIPYQIYFALYISLMPLIVLFDRKVVWKDRKF